MKPHAALCLMVLAGCATLPSPRFGDEGLASGSAGSAGGAPELTAPVRLETPAGTFLVHPQNAEDFARLLAGEPTTRHYFAGADAP